VIVNEGAVAQVMINRPQALNALNADVLQGLILAFERLQRNSAVRVVTLWGAGTEAFSAGMDVAAIVDLGPRPIADYVELGQRAMRALETCPVPVIAAVNGYAFGAGLELALACDLIVAAQGARFGLPEAGLGVLPIFGGMQRLLSRCGAAVTRRMVYTAELIDTAEALRIGLVDVLAPSGRLSEETTALADKISKQAPQAVSRAKSILRVAEEVELLAGLRREVEVFLSLYNTYDREEGMRAFMQKRTPEFRGC